MRSDFSLIFFLGVLSSMVSANRIQFFRKDYTYSAENDAFYKLHTNLQGLSWNSAFLACDDEEATLFYPKVNNEWKLFKHLAKKSGGDHNITEILIGVHDKFGLGEFITVDGHPIESSLSVKETDTSNRFPSGNCVFLNIYTGSQKVGPCVSEDLQEPLGFVCKKIESNETCPTIDLGYHYVKSSRKCYKVNRRLKLWDDAIRTCYLEGGILAVIENVDDAHSLKPLLGSDSETYHVGYRKFDLGDEYYTVKGQKLDSIYQNRYRNDDQSDKDCGAVYYSGSELYTTTTECDQRRPFICQLEINM